MHLQYVVLCDQVVIANDGKPSLIGILNELQTTAVPVTIPRIAFAARLHFTADETGKSHRVEVAITDPDGQEIGRPGGDISLPPAPAEPSRRRHSRSEAGPAPAGVDSIAVDLPLQFDLLELAAVGRYTFLMHVDAAPVGAAQLQVRQVTAA